MHLYTHKFVDIWLRVIYRVVCTPVTFCNILVGTLAIRFLSIHFFSIDKKPFQWKGEKNPEENCDFSQKVGARAHYNVAVTLKFISSASFITVSFTVLVRVFFIDKSHVLFGAFETNYKTFVMKSLAG